MRKLILAGLAACVATAPAAAAVTVSSMDGADPYGLPATFNFDAPFPEYNGALYEGTIVAVHAQPAGSKNFYGAVGGLPNAQTTATLDLSAFDLIDSITFLWGSIDTHNRLEVLGSGSAVLESFNGGSMGVAPATGNQSAANSNRLVTLTFTGADRANVTGLRFSSTRNAFEYDNVNVVTGAVPEPASWAMMVGGFAALGGALRRRRTATQFA